MRQYDFLIVGAGASGLTLASELLDAGSTVQIVERDERSGGLAKSYNYNGHIFDTGPKRFHTEDPIVNHFIKKRSSNNHIPIERRSLVHFQSRYLKWPLDLQSLAKLPIRTSIKSLLDTLRKKPNQKIENFRDYIIERYGETLYREFFGPYTQKFLNVDPSNIHQDWAYVGINRTIIDDSVQTGNLLQVLKSVLPRPKNMAQFTYPQEGGFGSFFDGLLTYCLSFSKHQFQLSTSTQIDSLEICKDHIEVNLNNGETARASQLIWTGNLNSLLDLLEIKTPMPLQYINTAFYNIICNEKYVKDLKTQWVYLSGTNECISRISFPREFNPSNCPKTFNNMIVEVTDSQDKAAVFGNQEVFRDKVIRELKSLNLLNSTTGIEDIYINEVKDTYPVYLKSYKEAYLKNYKLIKSKSPRIHLCGRSGAFWYNNSDHSIRMAIEMTKTLLKRSDHNFNHRSYFGAPDLSP